MSSLHSSCQRIGYSSLTWELSGNSRLLAYKSCWSTIGTIHRWVAPNNSFKPKPLRYTKGMAEKACHAFGSTTRFGLTQALGLMDTILRFMLLASIVAVLPAFAMAIYSERKLAQRLRMSHASLWTEITPSPWAEASLSSPFARFITQRKYLQLKDPELTRLGERARTHLYLAVSVFLVLVLCGLAESLWGS